MPKKKPSVAIKKTSTKITSEPKKSVKKSIKKTHRVTMMCPKAGGPVTVENVTGLSFLCPRCRAKVNVTPDYLKADSASGHFLRSVTVIGNSTTGMS